MDGFGEDLFEGDGDDFQLNGNESIPNPGPSQPPSQPGSRSSSLSYSSLTTPVFDDEDDEIYFPSYENDKSDNKHDCDSQIESVESSPETSPVLQRSVSPCPVERPEDDIAAHIPPSRHVDYLSHEWVEEDIWSSWKHLVSKKKIYPNSERLLNASWRTWEKKRRNLRTISPETVKWLKDHDVTWLYGPLQPGFCSLDKKTQSPNSRSSSTSHLGCQHKKPILKKRSLSELMLRRSISSASLLKQGNATGEAQNSRNLEDSTYNSFVFTDPGLSRANTLTMSSSTTSTHSCWNSDNTNWGSKNVRFHELVEQCISLTHLGDDEPDYHYVSDSDDEAVVMRKPMKQKRVTKQRLSPQTKEKCSISKTIEKLPHATLKCPLENEDNSAATPGVELGISKCPTQEPITRSTPSILGCDDDEDEDENWEPPTWVHNRRDSIQMFHDKLDFIKMLSPTENLSRDSSFLHRPVLERKDGIRDIPHVAKGPTIKGRDASVTFDIPPCRSQLADFSVSSNAAKTQHPTASHAMIDPAASSDDEGWAESIEISSSPSDYLSTGSDNDSENSGDIQTAPTSTPKPAKVTDEFLVGPSPRSSSDSGYGSETAWRVRDESQLRVEMEKGIKDWDIYHDDWDEVDEALAWQKEF